MCHVGTSLHSVDVETRTSTIVFAIRISFSFSTGARSPARTARNRRERNRSRTYPHRARGKGRLAVWMRQWTEITPGPKRARQRRLVIRGKPRLLGDFVSHYFILNVTVHNAVLAYLRYLPSRAIRIGYTNFAPDDELRLINMVNGRHPQPGDKKKLAGLLERSRRISGRRSTPGERAWAPAASSRVPSAPPSTVLSPRGSTQRISRRRSSCSTTWALGKLACPIWMSFAATARQEYLNLRPRACPSCACIPSHHARRLVPP